MGVPIEELLVAIEYDNSKTDRALTETEKKVRQLGDEFEKTEKKAGLSAKQQAAAAESLQRQRSAALLKQWKEEERAHAASLKATQEQAGAMGGLLASINPVTIAMTVATGAAVGLAAALVNIVSIAIEVGSELNDLSLKTGLSVETLSGLRLQLTQSGSDLDTFGRAVFILEKNLAEAANGNRELKKTFADLGIKDAKAGLQDVEGTVRKVFKSLGELDTGARNAQGAKVLSKSMQELSVFIADTGGDIDAVVEKAREMGLVMSTDSAQAADRLGDEIDALSARATAFGVEIGSRIIPSILHALDEANAGYQGHQSVVGSVIGAVTSYLEAEIEKLAILASQANNIGRIMAGIRNGPGGVIMESIGVERSRQARKKAAEMGRESGSFLGNAIRAPKGVGGVGGGGSGGGGRRRGGGGGGADKELQERLRMLQIEARAVEMAYDRETDVIERYYDRRLTSLETYTQEALAAEEKRYQAVLALLEKELALAGKSGSGRAVKEAEAAQKIEAEKLKHGQTVSKLLDEQYNKERSAAERHAQGLLSIQEQVYRNQITEINQGAQMPWEKTAAADAVSEIEKKAFAARRKLLQDEIEAKEKNKEDTRALKDQLGLMEVQYTELILEQNERRKQAEKEYNDYVREAMEERERQIQEEIDAYMEAITQFSSDIVDVFNNSLDTLFEEGFGAFFEKVLAGFIDMLRQMVVEFLKSQLATLMQDLLGGLIKTAVGAGIGAFGSAGISNAGSVSGNSSGGAAAAALGGFRAEGGPVASGVPYVVGERGPEVFAPSSNGQIISNEDIRAAVGAGESSGSGRSLTIGAVHFSFPNVKDRREARATEAQMARAFMGMFERHAQMS